MTDSRPRNDAAMAEILASIRRIVADEDTRGAQGEPSPEDQDVLVLTQSMRVPEEEGDLPGPLPAAISAFFDKPHAGPRVSAPQQASRKTSAPEAELSVDEAAVVDIARVVLRDEFEGEFGRNMTEQITQLVRAEVARALAEQGRARD